MSSVTTQWILDLTDKVTAPLRNITGQALDTSQAVDVVQMNMEKLEQRASSLQSKLTKFTIGVAAFAALSYGSMQFETGMARANTMALKSQEEFNKVADSVRNIADVVPIARTQLTDGLYNVISVGVPDDNWIQFLEDSSKTAIAGNAQLGTVVNSTSSIIKSYGLEWDKAGAIQDKLMKTVQLGQIPSLDALSQALSKPGPIASQLGVTIDELMASMTALAGPNGEVNETGTQMKAVMSSVLKPTSEAAKMAQKLGVAFDATAIKGAGGLVPFLENLSQKTQDYSKQSGIAIETIYGQLFSSTEALSAVMSLTGPQQAIFAENALKIANSSGVVSEAFEIMNQTSEMQMIMMKNSFQSTMDEIVGVITPFVIIGTQGIGKVFQVVRQFANENPRLFQVVTTIGFAAAVMYGVGLAATFAYTKIQILTLQMWGYVKSVAASIWNGLVWFAEMAIGTTTVIGSFIIGIANATLAQLGFNIAISANPIGAFIIGVLALIFVVVSLVKHWEKVKAAFTEGGILEGLKAIGFALIDSILAPVQKLLELVSKIPGMQKIAGNAAEEILNMRRNLFNKDFLKQAQEKEGEKPKDKKKGMMDMLGLGGFEMPDQPVIPQGDYNSPSNTLEGSGSSGAGKSITMNLNIVNHFNVDSHTNIDYIAEKVVGKVNDRLRDAMVSV